MNYDLCYFASGQRSWPLFSPLSLIGLVLLVSLLGSSGLAAQPGPDKDERTILLRGYRFDPLRQDQEGVNTDLRVPAELNYCLVQFTGRLNREQHGIVTKEIGLKLNQYVPNNTFLEKLTEEQTAQLRRLPFYRWDGPYRPRYKVDPDIGKHKFTTKERQAESGIILMIVGFPEADVDKVAEEIKGRGYEVIATTNEPELGIKRWQVRVRTARDATALAELPEVRYLEELGEVTLNNGTTSWVIQSNVNGSRPIWDAGLQGQGQIIGHIDGLLDINHCFFMDATDNTVRPDHRKVVGLRNSSNTANQSDHGTFSAGNAMGEDVNNDATSATPNANNGMAPRARVTHGNLSDLDLNAGGGTSFLNYLNQAKADGAFIHTNSWDPKNTNNYTQVSADADQYTWDNEDHLIIFGPDNAGPIRPGSNAKNVFVVNATLQSPNQNNFRSGVTQFTQDGRRKPDIMAPGGPVNSADGGTACGLRTTGGTSFAAPAVAGAASLVRQYFTEGWYPTGDRQPQNALTPTGNLMKAVLANATVDATGINGYPGVAGTGEGWGRLLLDNGLFFAGDNRNLTVWDVRRANGLFATESHTYTIRVDNPAQPLRVTLAWSEPAAVANTSGGAAEAVGSLTINDLDLTVTAPDGTTVFSGNDFNTNTGVSNPNGGVADGLNVLEQVILNNPVVGEYTITVGEGGNGINQGPQGYGLVVTADLPDPPAPTGNQNTLVVRTGLSDLFAGALPNLTSVQNIMTEVTDYIDEVSYGTTTINPSYATVTLPQPSTFYYHPSRNVLVEMTEDAIAGLLAADPGTFDQGTAAPADDIDRLILVVNDPNFTGHWATTGAWSYNLPGGITRPISVSVQSTFNDPVPRFTHGVAHQLGLKDLYAHPGVVFAQPHVDNWDHMAVSAINTGFMAWSKEQATWITTHGSSVDYIPRPAGGGTTNQTIGINFISSTGTNRKAIAVGLTEGAAALEDEQVFYYIEARDSSAGTVDENLPGSGVLLYYVNENIPQGQGPVRIIDKTVATPTLDDAALAIGESLTTAEGLTITVLAGTGGADRNIQLTYTPPPTDNDVNIVKGSPVWTSPDIWVDSPKDGFDADLGRTPMDRGDQAVLGVVNRLYYRIHNPGPDAARDFMIYARISEPYHTVGGEADFNLAVGQRFVGTLNNGADLVDYFEWTPTADGDPHSCAQVSIPNVFNDINELNNTAQQNLQVVPSVTASPYESVTYSFGFTNPEDHQELFYFRAQGIPDGWSATMTPASARLAGGERMEATLTVQPPDDAPVCNDHPIEVSSWSPRGNTMILVGGGTVQVNLRNRTTISLETDVRDCKGRPNDEEEVVIFDRVSDRKPSQAQAAVSAARKCKTIVAGGCTNPIRANQEITLRYTTPAGYPLYRTVMTDAQGCYSDTYVVTEGGAWNVTAEYPGDDCSGPATTGVGVGIPLPTTGDQDGDGRPDADEPQGDHDQDGIPGIFDTDSDNDGILDGEEPDGDPDQDGHPNPTDPDSDNDGTPDGKDNTPYGDEDPRPTDNERKLQWGAHVGSSHPLGDFDDNNDANIYVGLDLGYRFSNQWRVLLLGGLHQFTREIPVGGSHTRYLQLSADLERTFPASVWGRNYVRVGAGYYRPKVGGNQLGYNLGLGSDIAIGGNRFVRVGLDYHLLSGDGRTSFLTARLGVLFP